MRINNIYKLWIAVLPLMVASCQSEDMPEIANETGIQAENTLRAVMGQWGQLSRAQVKLNNPDASQETFMWNANDSFTLIDLTSDNATSTYEISGYSEESPSSSADFVGKGELVAGHQLTAIYPANTTFTGGNLILSVDSNNSLTSNSADELKSYMSKNMLMTAKSTASATTSLQFNHLCAMVRVSLCNIQSEALTVSTVKINSPDAFGVKGIVNPVDGGVVTDGTLSDMTFNYSSLSIASGDTEDFYFLFLPGSDLSGNVTITINDKEVTIPTAEIIANGSTKFQAGRRYWFNLLYTGVKLIRKSDIPEGVISNLKLIAEIEEYEKMTFERDDNGFVNIETNKEKIESIESILFHKNSEHDIEDMSGIEAFVNLTNITLYYTKVKSLDLTKNTKLERILCQPMINSGNGLESLNVRGLKHLREIEVSGNKLTTLDLRGLENLELLNIGGNEISSIEIDNSPNLKKLWMGGSEITNFDVTRFPELIIYTPGKSTKLDLSRNTKLEQLVISNQQITTLDLSKNPNLYYLNINGCKKLITLDLSNNTKLSNLYINNNGIEGKLDLSNSSELVVLNCSNNELSGIDITKCVNMTKLSCNSNHISELDISNIPKLILLECGAQTDFVGNDMNIRVSMTTAQMEQLGSINNNSYNKNIITVVKE